MRKKIKTKLSNVNDRSNVKLSLIFIQDCVYEIQPSYLY